MSTESSEFDDISSTEGIELMEFFRRSDSYSNSESSTDFSPSCVRSITQSETYENKSNDPAFTLLNTSDETHHEFDIQQASLSSLKDISLGNSNRASESPLGQSNVLTRKASSLDGLSIPRVSSLDHLKGTSTRTGSSLNALGGLSTGWVSTGDPLEKLSTKRISSLDPFERHSTTRVSSLNPLEGLSTSKISSPYTQEGPSTKRVSSLDPLESPSTWRISSFDAVKGSSVRKASSLDVVKSPSIIRKVSSLDAVKGSPTRRVSSLDPLEGPSTRRVSSLDPLESPSTRRFSFLDPLKGPSNRMVSSLDPLEGPSTRTIWFTDSAEGSLTSICKSSISEAETSGPSNSVVRPEQNGFRFRVLAWLSSFLRRYSRQIRHSKYFLVIHVVLFGMSCLTAYMSSKYYSLCDACAHLPLLVGLLGLLGVWIMTIEIVTILSKRHFAPPLTGQEFCTWTVTLHLSFFILLSFEMFSIYICKTPKFIPLKKYVDNEVFCVKVFYDYVCYLNVTVPMVIAMMMLIHIPGIFDPAEAD